MFVPPLGDLNTLAILGGIILVLIVTIIISLALCFSKRRARYYTREDNLNSSKYKRIFYCNFSILIWLIRNTQKTASNGQVLFSSSLNLLRIAVMFAISLAKLPKRNSCLRNFRRPKLNLKTNLQSNKMLQAATLSSQSGTVRNEPKYPHFSYFECFVANQSIH